MLLKLILYACIYGNTNVTHAGLPYIIDLKYRTMTFIYNI